MRTLLLLLVTPIRSDVCTERCVKQFYKCVKNRNASFCNKEIDKSAHAMVKNGCVAGCALPQGRWQAPNVAPNIRHPNPSIDHT